MARRITQFGNFIAAVRILTCLPAQHHRWIATLSAAVLSSMHGTVVGYEPVSKVSAPSVSIATDPTTTEPSGVGSVDPSGSASTQASGTPAETPSQAELSSQVQQRAEARWDALVSKDFSRAYEFELPSYRELFTERTFSAGFAADPLWVGAAVTDVELVGNERAEVSVEIKQSIPFASRGNAEIAVSSVAETWLFREHAWWHVLNFASSETERPDATPDVQELAPAFQEPLEGR